MVDAKPMKWTDDQLDAADVALGQIYTLDNGGCGCCLHIVVDDHNLDSVEFCLEYAQEQGHPYCVAMARMLLTMTIKERGEVILSHMSSEERNLIVSEEIADAENEPNQKDRR